MVITIPLMWIVYSILLTLLIPPLVLVIILWVWKRSNRIIRTAITTGGGGGNDIIICGQAGSGKTKLFLHLVTEYRPTTLTSASMNVGKFNDNKELTIKDIPGNSKLRDSILDDNSSSARGIILLLDSSNTGFLHLETKFILHVISTAIDRKIPILIVSGKEDLGGLTALESITSIINAELRKLAKKFNGGRRGGNPADEYHQSDQDILLNSNVSFVLKRLGIEEDEPERLTLDELATIINIKKVGLSANNQSSIDYIRNWILAI